MTHFVGFRTALFALLIVCASCLDASEPTFGEKLFALKVKTLFAKKCNACHGADADKIEGGFNMMSRDSMLAGGDAWGEEVLVAGEGEHSFLYLATTREEEGYEMPPKQAEQLTEEQTWWIRDWIDAGAPWPSEKRVLEIQLAYAEGEVVPTSGGLSDDWTNRRYKPEDLWAYRPLKVQEVPKAVHPIDWFIDQKLEALELEPAPEATAQELIRRLSFGLTGLPPTEVNPKIRKLMEVDVGVGVEFYANQLMDSPHYGEHFGRQWLDVARYADSAGFANDYSRPNAWRYRDYVVRAFNQDKPYDEFVKQQIAGDELDDANPENVVATGFLRMGPWEQTGMSVFKVTRQQWLDDVTDSVGQAFLAHPLQCCKCHDHKFDPLPTRDYYSMMAVFSTTQFSERDTPFMEEECNVGFEAAQKWTKAKIAAYEKQRGELNARVKQNKKQESGDAKIGDNGLDPGDEASLARMGKNIARHRWELDKTRPIAFAVYTGKTITRNNVGQRVEKPKFPWNKGEMEQDAILTGGDVFSPSDPVQPGPLSAAVKLGEMPEVEFPTHRGKRRMALANWITNSKNPLAARVMVNRVWSWHFGKGIAGNPNNFGATGSHPTHPELLDYLADWFMRNGWSVKALNRMILSSRAYLRSTKYPESDLLDEKDPKRESYAVFLPRRLTAEELRDAMLATSGELNRQVGGIPCRPEINIEVAMQPRQIMGGTASVYEPDPLPQHRNRRSLYAEKIRGLRDPFFETFNQPGPDKSCELRETSTVAPQALTLMNAAQVQARSLAFASKLMQEQESDERRLVRGFELALGRAPTKNELTACRKHWQQSTEAEQENQPRANVYENEVKRTVMAEKTGEPYDFIEIMPAYEEYVPDLQASDVDAKTRGLSQVLLVIFNLNEFSYLD